jgi:hypothetical protein
MAVIPTQDRELIARVVPLVAMTTKRGRLPELRDGDL